MKKYKLNFLFDEETIMELVCDVRPGSCIGCPGCIAGEGFGIISSQTQCLPDSKERFKKLLEYGWISEVEVKE